MVVSQPALAEVDWYTFTMDNDVFVGVDAGYTNGMYFSWYDTPLNNKPEHVYFFSDFV